MNDSIERLSFELTRRAFDEQDRYVTSLRNGAGIVLGTASIATPLLATRVAGRPLDVWAALAMIAYVLCLASAVGVLLPRELVISFSGTELLAAGNDAGADVSEAYRAAVRWSKSRLTRNRRKIDRLADWLTMSCLLLAVEIVSWVISLIG
jgi:hypothetical protein